MDGKIKKTIFLSLFVSVGLVLSLVEMNLPILFMAPGAKIGLSNLAILLVLYYYDLKESLLVTILKSSILLVATGNVIGFYYGLISGLLSTLVMYISKKSLDDNRGILSIIGVSILGAISHNISQIYIATLILKTKSLLLYIPILVLISVFTGGFIGYLAKIVKEKLILR